MRWAQIVAFTDDDCVPSPELVQVDKSIIEAFIDVSVDAIRGVCNDRKRR